MIAEDYLIIPSEALLLVSAQQAWHYKIVPKETQPKDGIEFYLSDKADQTAVINELEVMFGKRVYIQSKPDHIIQQTLGKYYRNNLTSTNTKQVNTGSIKSDDFLQTLISEAKTLGSSDIHIEIYEEKCRIRIRIDGHLIERYSVGKNDYPTLVNKIKIKANLDISEKRLPQDGRIFFKTEALRIDIRVSILPTLYGEKIVLRLLNNDSSDIDIRNLGFTEKELEDYSEGIKKPHGIILISGPTGSGKTTTLYATLKLLNKEKSNIITIEDPIEYTLDGVNQVQMREDIGLTFAAALRSFLRQDPDVIMLGEIRDAETAHMAIRAALTGHLVLSTIHTNSAWGTISRLLDMGVPPFLLAGTLNTSVAQRLVRLLCPACKIQHEFSPELLPKKFNYKEVIIRHFSPGGCTNCHYTGYKGRKALYEVIPIDQELAEHIKNNTFGVELLLAERNIKTLRENAWELFKNGLTSIEEVYPILINNY